MSKSKIPNSLKRYIRGEDSIPQLEDVSEYKEYLIKILEKEIESNYLILYRGFSSSLKKGEISKIFYEDCLVSFTESRDTAIKIAEERSEDLDENGYVIEIKVPLNKVYFHYLFDKMGKEYPNEKEVIINPFNCDWELIYWTKC